MPYKRKPKVLKRKNIKRRTGAKAQSKQIVALSKQVSSLTKSNYETIQTTWNRQNLSIDTALGGIGAYICPIPKSMGNCFNQSTVDTDGLSDRRLKWADNLVIAAQPFYQKTSVFGSSDAARNSPESTHMGGILKYRLSNMEPSFSTYSIFLISPKSRQADQLITDRRLKGTTGGHNPGSGAILNELTDYITHPNVMGTMFNKKYWNIDYHREVNFGHPGSSTLQTTAQANNTNPLNNALIATGTIRLKPGGVLRCFNTQQNNSERVGRLPISASQIGYVDEKNEKLQYLVIVNDGVSTDTQTVNLSLLVRDFYKVTV